MTSVVQASYTYADGTQVAVMVQVPESYPDALNQARNEAVRGVQQIMGVEDMAFDDEVDEG